MSDFCYSWPVLNRIFHQVELMDRMMGLVGINPAVAGRVDNGVAWYEARTNCVSCSHERECGNWLECSEGLPAPPVFCPNVEFFRRCVETDACTQPAAKASAVVSGAFEGSNEVRGTIAVGPHATLPGVE